MRKTNMFLIVCLLTIVVLLLEGGAWAIGIKSLWLPWLVFMMPILWIMWLICFFMENKVSRNELIFLWILIDIAALCVIMASATFSNNSSRNDSDYLFVIAFSPMILPTLLLLKLFPFLSEGLMKIFKSAMDSFPDSLNIALQDWLFFSVVAIISVLLLNFSRYFLRSIKNSLKLRQSG